MAEISAPPKHCGSVRVGLHAGFVSPDQSDGEQHRSRLALSGVTCDVVFLLCSWLSSSRICTTPLVACSRRASSRWVHLHATLDATQSSQFYWLSGSSFSAFIICEHYFNSDLQRTKTELLYPISHNNSNSNITNNTHNDNIDEIYWNIPTHAIFARYQNGCCIINNLQMY